MLEQEEPFKTMLKFYHFCGLWQAEKLTRRHRILARVAFVLFKVLPFVLTILSFLQDETAYEYAKSTSLVFSLIMNSGYIMTFLILKTKIQELFDEINTILETRPDAIKYLNIELRLAKRMEVQKVIGTTIWVLMGIVSMLFVQDVSVAMWQPESLKGRLDFFYALWLYQSIHITYLALVVLFLQDFFFTFLRVINALMKHLRDDLQGATFCGREGKMKLVQCVENHRDIRK
jgi:hypothetical protein